MTNAAYEGTSDARRTALGTLLIERGMLDEDRLEEALQIGEENNERLGEVLVRLAWVSEEDLAKVLADQWHLRYCERSAISFDGEALRRMSREDAARLEALPIQVDHDGVLVVALAEPTESRLMALRTLLGDNIDFVVVAKGAIEAGLRSELLARNSGGQFAQFVDENETSSESDDAPAEPSAEEPEQGLFEAPAPLAPVVELPSTPAVSLAPPASGGADGFQEVAGSLTSSVEQHLATLRDMIDEAVRQREQDRREIERLKAELEARDSEIGERDETIQATQQMLRDLADRLA